jgi:hypothetical protein
MAHHLRTANAEAPARTSSCPPAAEFGYVPHRTSPTRAKGVKGGRAIARKVATDYCAAYLIARWARRPRKTRYGTYDSRRHISLYNTEAIIRKKDVDAENR